MKLAGLRSRIGIINWACGAALAVAANAAHALAEPWQLNMTQGVTDTSKEVYALHMWVLWVCVVIGIIVFGAMIWSMIFHRKSKGAVAARWSHNTRVEAIWTVIPILILVSLAWPATNVLLKMAYTEKSDMTIKVTGYQWKWGYDYVNVGEKPYHVHFISRLDPLSDKTRELKSGMDPRAVKVGNEQTYLLDVDKPLVIPADTKVRFVVTGDDVIHAWWVPQFGWKQDAIPGIINDAWTEVHEPGVYRGQCAELCGQDHGFMPIVVKVVPKAEFQTWIDQQEAAMHPAPTAPAAPAATAPAPSAPASSAPAHS
jgi:cytochrome c oxidase subunit 2